MHGISSSLICVYVKIFLVENFHAGLLIVANRLLKYCGVTVVCTTTIFESYCKRHAQQKLWRIYHHIESDIKYFDHMAVLRDFLINFGLFYVSATLLYVKYGILTLSACGWIEFAAVFSYVTFMMMQDLRIIYYKFFVRLLDHQLHEVEMEVKSLADDSEHKRIARDSSKRI